MPRYNRMRRRKAPLRPLCPVCKERRPRKEAICYVCRKQGFTNADVSPHIPSPSPTPTPVAPQPVQQPVTVSRSQPIAAKRPDSSPWNLAIAAACVFLVIVLSLPSNNSSRDTPTSQISSTSTSVSPYRTVSSAPSHYTQATAPPQTWQAPAPAAQQTRSTDLAPSVTSSWTPVGTSPQSVYTPSTSIPGTPPTSASTPQTSNGYYSRYYDSSYRPAVGNHYVRGHYRSDGTWVNGHYKTDSDDSFWNNWSSKGNANPYTGRIGSKRLPSYSGYSGGSSYVRGYYRKDGTYVSGHYRRSRR